MEFVSYYSRSVGYMGKVFHLGQEIVYVLKDMPYGTDYEQGIIVDIGHDGIVVKDKWHRSRRLLFDNIDHISEA